MTCRKPVMAVRRKDGFRSKRSFGNQRYARASRRFKRNPMDISPGAAYASRKANKRYVSGARTAAAAAGHPRCTKLYAASLVDPSGDHSKGACLPAGFPMPSQKIRVFARGFMATGVTGDGFIMWTPQLANDATAVTNSTAASVGGAATAFNAFTAPVATVLAKIPYTTAQLTGGTVEGRLVSGCLRCRYSGTEDLRAGVVSLFEDPDHVGIGGLTANGISLFDSCGKQRVFGDGGWHQINWSGPCKQAEQEYIQGSAFAPVVVVISINGTIAAGGALGAAPFEWECWENLEYLGRDVVGKTNNVLDPQGTAAVIGAAKVAQSGSDPLNPSTGGSMLRKLFAGKPGGTAAGDIIHGAVSMINPGAGMIYGGLRKAFGYGRFRKSMQQLIFLTNRQHRPHRRPWSYGGRCL